MIGARPNAMQEYDARLSEKLKKILHYENEGLMVAIPDMFGDLSQYTARSRAFWKKHLLSFRRIYEQECSHDKVYQNAFVSRMYYNYLSKENCGRWFEKLRQIWDGRKLILVEGEAAHNGVENDLFDAAESIERIICPSRDAFKAYDRILEECEKQPKDRLFLISLGSTAKPLTADLYEKGYRVIDIGNLDMEYEWYLQRADNKPKLRKHGILGREANEAAGYLEYLSQITAKIELS